MALKLLMKNRKRTIITLALLIVFALATIAYNWYAPLFPATFLLLYFIMTLVLTVTAGLNYLLAEEDKPIAKLIAYIFFVITPYLPLIFVITNKTPTPF